MHVHRIVKMSRTCQCKPHETCLDHNVSLVYSKAANHKGIKILIFKEHDKFSSVHTCLLLLGRLDLQPHLGAIGCHNRNNQKGRVRWKLNWKLL